MEATKVQLPTRTTAISNAKTALDSLAKDSPQTFVLNTLERQCALMTD